FFGSFAIMSGGWSVNDGQRIGRGETPPEQRAETSAEPGIVPRPLTTSQLFGVGRLDPVREQRAAAASQIQRSLKAWRAANGAAGNAAIPKGPGQPLPATVRERMEPKLGADLSSVRVHTAGDSAKAARDLGARAFTVGEDVHFNAGEFQPGSKEGDKLLAHEL